MPIMTWRRSVAPIARAPKLTRILGHVGGGPAGERDYAAMSAGEMLSVLEMGDAREAKRLYEAVGRGDKALAA